MQQSAPTSCTTIYSEDTGGTLTRFKWPLAVLLFNYAMLQTYRFQLPAWQQKLWHASTNFKPLWQLPCGDAWTLWEFLLQSGIALISHPPQLRTCYMQVLRGRSSWNTNLKTSSRLNHTLADTAAGPPTSCTTMLKTQAPFIGSLKWASAVILRARALAKHTLASYQHRSICLGNHPSGSNPCASCHVEMPGHSGSSCCSQTFHQYHIHLSSGHATCRFCVAEAAATRI
jgi:hypothetical protein